MCLAAEFHSENKLFPRPGEITVNLRALFILVTKFSDTGAYAVGSLIGKHK